MTILELPNRLPGWGYCLVGSKSITSIWIEDVEIMAVPGTNYFWQVAIKNEEHINAFIYVDAIRRK